MPHLFRSKYPFPSALIVLLNYLDNENTELLQLLLGGYIPRLVQIP